MLLDAINCAGINVVVTAIYYSSTSIENDLNAVLPNLSVISITIAKVPNFVYVILLIDTPTIFKNLLVIAGNVFTLASFVVTLVEKDPEDVIYSFLRSA